MALTKFPNLIVQSRSYDFDLTYPPGCHAPHSGIYRCDKCGLEAVSIEGDRLPPVAAHAHGENLPVEWRLIIATHDSMLEG